MDYHSILKFMLPLYTNKLSKGGSPDCDKSNVRVKEFVPLNSVRVVGKIMYEPYNVSEVKLFRKLFGLV
jgi:hypothetical protein